MRIIFMGSAELACPALAGLLAHDGFEVAGVVTQPDRPRGRRLRLAACPAKALAEGRGATVLTPADVNAPESLAELRRLAPDIVVVVAYGQKLGNELLALPPRGCVNVHASLLPRYRGAAPIQWAIAEGETVTGVTIMYMNDRMDGGDIILQRDVPIGDDDTAGTLHDRMAEAGALALLEGLSAIDSGRATRTVQDEARATHAPKLTKEDGHIDWSWPAEQIRNRVRAFSPWPCCWCVITPGDGSRPRKLRILSARVEPDAPRPGESIGPGTVLDIRGDGPLIATGSAPLRLLDVQPEGGKRMAGDAYLCGHALAFGAVLA